MLCITCIVTSTPGMKLWNVTFMGCTCDSESEPHTCVVIYRQLQCVCGIVLGNSQLQCVFGNSVRCKSQLQCTGELYKWQCILRKRWSGDCCLLLAEWSQRRVRVSPSHFVDTLRASLYGNAVNFSLPKRILQFRACDLLLAIIKKRFAAVRVPLISLCRRHCPASV